MLRKITSGFAVAVVVGVFGAGCAANKAEKPVTHAAHGVLCPTCETVWITDTVGQGTKVQRLVTEKRMTCPDCDRMAKAYLEGDRLVLHDCPTCKATPRPVVKGAPPTHLKGSRGST
jgi:Zn finger protein HypA/HybF involved in hydrogenase expression